MPKILDRSRYFKEILTFKVEEYKKDKSSEVIAKRNTKCQFRAGMEYIYKDAENNEAYESIFKNVGFTYVLIDEKKFKHRFYIEELAIGLLKPPFNFNGLIQFKPFFYRSS
ncbi:hypothetical protein GGR27_000005 [Lewinella antarctica]|uniref:LAGLIDADG homing endonuclease n=2 Tax=Neolewinella antarctica TaxID=442734 RepID=A0ABX0X681_9BACT|nr:hypothetical protein [Neolewinella antarctica]